jgi:hypothetical protein
MDDGCCPGSDIFFANLGKEGEVSTVVNGSRGSIRMSSHFKGLDSNPSLTDDMDVA